MWFFQKEKRLFSTESDVLELQKQVKTLKTRVDGLELEYETLRNKVLRKIQSKRAEESLGGEEKETNLYNGMLIRSNG